MIDLNPLEWPSRYRPRSIFIAIILCVGTFFQVDAVSQNRQVTEHEDTLEIVTKNEKPSEEVVFLSGTFYQKKYISVLPNPLISHGSFMFSKDKAIPSLTWTTIEPINSVLYFDSKGIRQNVEGETAWDIAADQPAVATLTEVITAVLSSNWNTLENYFDILILDPSQQNIPKSFLPGSAEYSVIQLASRDAALKSVVTSMTIILNSEMNKKISQENLSAIEGNVKQLVMHEANGDRTEIVFTFPDDVEP